MSGKQNHPWSDPVSPTVTIGGVHGDEEISRHPAFGVVIVTAPQGGRTTLNGSDFQHNNTIRIEVHESEQIRQLSGTRHSAQRLVCQFELSHAQFVRMVTSQGQGGGTPCTLLFAEGQFRNAIETEEHTTDKFSKELKLALQAAVSNIDEAISALASANNSATRKAAVESLKLARRKLFDSSPYIADRFDEHISQVVQDAMAEAHAYLNSTITQAGLAALQPKQLEDNRDANE